ncbi:MAG: septum formation protein Maf [Pirellulales bacterium]|nr:septum formation protein Maf [Pirellulales bacterium]
MNEAKSCDREFTVVEPTRVPTAGQASSATHSTRSGRTFLVKLADLFPTKPKLVLASGSPRRRMLLAEAGFEFDVVTPAEGAECGVCSGETPPEHVARLAWQKAADVAPRVERGLLVACDTVAECLGQILGKPRDEAHARAMLQTLSGREHRVYSGLCVWQLPAREPLVEVDCTVLRMDPLGDRQLDEYLASGEWEGKAGAFGFQDGLDWVHIVEGSESNVVGLPMERLARMLAKVVPTSGTGC